MLFWHHELTIPLIFLKLILFHDQYNVASTCRRVLDAIIHHYVWSCFDIMILLQDSINVYEVVLTSYAQYNVSSTICVWSSFVMASSKLCFINLNSIPKYIIWCCFDIIISQHMPRFNNINVWRCMRTTKVQTSLRSLISTFIVCIICSL